MEASPETRLFRAYWDDGTLDLVGGAAVVLTGLTFVFEQLVFIGAVVALGLVTWWGIRRRVVEPRAGYVAFAQTRRERSERELVGTIATGLGVLAMVAFGAVRLRGGVPGEVVAGLPAALLAVGAGLTGGLTRAWRFGGYALVLVAAAVATVVLGLDPGWPLVVTGLGLWAAGAVLFGRFLVGSRRFEEAGG